MDNKIIEFIKECEDLWKEIQNEYCYKDIPLIFIDTFDDRVKYLGDNSMMTTCFTALVEDPNLPDDDTIVEGLKVEVYMPLEQLYYIIIKCELNFDKALKYIKICLKHEMGHVIYENSVYVGKTYTEWMNGYNKSKNDYNSLPEIKADSNDEYLFNRFNKFFSLSGEKEANDIVGITKEDINYLWRI